MNKNKITIISLVILLILTIFSLIYSQTMVQKNKLIIEDNEAEIKQLKSNLEQSNWEKESLERILKAKN